MIEKLGLHAYLKFLMAAGHVGKLGSFEFTFCSVESCAELQPKWAKITPNYIV